MLPIFSNRLHIAALIASALLVLVALSTAAPTYAAGIVTNCSNDTDFSNKLVGGGTVTFNCGTATINLSSTTSRPMAHVPLQKTATTSNSSWANSKPTAGRR